MIPNTKASEDERNQPTTSQEPPSGSTLYRNASNIETSPPFHKKPDSIEISGFIKKKFRQRKCKKFVCKTKTKDIQTCHCGYDNSGHSGNALHQSYSLQAWDVPSEPRWSLKTHTETYTTNSFGKLEFTSSRQCWPHSRFLRLDYDTGSKAIMELLIEIWKVDTPDLILSIITDRRDANAGNSISVSDKEKIKQFCRYLVKTAIATNSWIITDGTDNYVNKIIGDEIVGTQRPKALIGFSNWGCLRDKDILVSEGRRRRDCEKNFTPQLTLNKSHSHFFLVDDSRQGYPGCEFDLRRRVEMELRRMRKSQEKNDSNGIPLIYILIGGDIKIYNDVECAVANNIPVIIVEGTGNAADKIADSVKSSRKTEGPRPNSLFDSDDDLRLRIECYHTDFKEKILNEISSIETNSRGEHYAEIANAVEKVKPDGLFNMIKNLKDNERNRSDMNDSSRDNTDHVRDKILQAFIDLLKQHCVGKTHDSVERIKAVLDELQRNLESGFSSDEQEEDDAIARLRHLHLQDVKLQLLVLCEENNYDQLNQCILEALKRVKTKDPNSIYLLAAKFQSTEYFRGFLRENSPEFSMTEVMVKLMEKNKYEYVKILLEQRINLKGCLKELSEKGMLDEEDDAERIKDLVAKKDKLDNLNDPDEDDQVKKLIAKILFIWCARKGQFEMAKNFWYEGKDHLAMALVGCHESELRREANQKIFRDPDEDEKLLHQRRNFEKLSLELLRSYYAKNRAKTHQLLIGAVPDLGGETPLDIAVQSGFKAFVAERSVQDLLEKIWHRNIVDLTKNYNISFVSTLICPFLAPILFDLRQAKHQPDKEQKKTVNVVRQRNKAKSERFRNNYERSKAYCVKLWNFLGTPKVKFSYNLIFFLVYLIVFSIVMLTDFRAKISPLEIFLTVWTFVLIVDEIHQFAHDLKSYIKQWWNTLDIFAMNLFVIGFILRMIFHINPDTCTKCLYVARVFYAFSLMFFFMRTLQFMSISTELGPKIYMIRHLTWDLLKFMLILMVIVSAYGVVSNVILYPNQPLNGKLLGDVFYDAWWSVLQQFNTDDALGLNCNDSQMSMTCSSPDGVRTDDVYRECKANKCPADTWIVSILLAFYALIVIIMMLNILIAIFNVTFSSVNDRQIEVSRMQRYHLIREYCMKSKFPPPFSIFRNLKYIKTFAKCCKTWYDMEKNDNDSNAGSLKSLGDSKIDDKEKIITIDRHMPKKPIKRFAIDLTKNIQIWEQKRIDKYLETQNLKAKWLIAHLEPEEDETGVGNNQKLIFQKQQDSLMEYFVDKANDKIGNNSEQRTGTDSDYKRVVEAAYAYQKIQEQTEDSTSRITEELKEDIKLQIRSLIKNDMMEEIRSAIKEVSEAATRSFPQKEERKFSLSVDKEKKKTVKTKRDHKSTQRDQDNKSPTRDQDKSPLQDQEHKLTPRDRDNKSPPQHQDLVESVVRGQKLEHEEPIPTQTNIETAVYKERRSSLITERPSEDTTVDTNRSEVRRTRDFKTKKKARRSSVSLSCIHTDNYYESLRPKSEQQQSIHKKRNTITLVKGYPALNRRIKTACPCRSCMIKIYCKNGRIIHLRKPFSGFGVPPNSKAFGGYVLPLKEEIARIEYICMKENGMCGNDNVEASSSREIDEFQEDYMSGNILSLRTPYGGYCLENSKPGLKRRSTHRPLHVSAVRKQKILTKRPKTSGGLLQFIPARKYSPEFRN